MSITFKLAIRRLRRSPATTVFATLALALSVGAAGASTFLLNAIVLRPLETRSPEQLVSIAPMIGEAILGIPGPTLAALRDSSDTMRQVCGYSRGAAAVQVGDRISRKGLEAFSGSCYELLGVRPFLGRLIAEEDAPLVGVSAPVTVMTYSFWQTAFNADAQAVGKTLMVEGKPLTIIGVLPRSFVGMHVDQGPDLIVPLGLMNTLRGLPPRTLALYAITRGAEQSGTRSVAQRRARRVAGFVADDEPRARVATGTGRRSSEPANRIRAARHFRSSEAVHPSRYSRWSACRCCSS